MPDVSRGGIHHIESDPKSETRRGVLERAGPGESAKGRREILWPVAVQHGGILVEIARVVTDTGEDICRTNLDWMR